MEEEEIEIKPPIDRIPDEYEHFTEENRKIHVHIFSIAAVEAKEKVKCFRESLMDKDFPISEYSLETDNCDNILNESKYFLKFVIR